ncbi:hypothetical protein ACVIHI_008144 [Bradyrhizobium sp. USDA 4524]|nr:hypothetical protein [Bradyrhizobium sp. USDA 4538]MCP1899506.1 hypothetical protein [Bradyrhizobium sp. USDA 4537]MCP1909791.1 hypothetical protein [Bradyrhizobium elkanii]MCP1986385.1 hypothetical protein [Bradyrhizobium sp. USDA 4539]
MPVMSISHTVNNAQPPWIDRLADGWLTKDALRMHKEPPGRPSSNFMEAVVALEAAIGMTHEAREARL